MTMASLKNNIKSFAKNKNAVTTMMLFAIGFIIMMIPSLRPHADDLFSSGKAQINDSFGKDSTVVWIIYVIEILAAAFMYIKTKNLAIFGGIAALIIFMNVVFGLL